MTNCMHFNWGRRFVSELLRHHFCFIALDHYGKSASWIEQCLKLQDVPSLSRCAEALSNSVFFLLAGPGQKAAAQTASNESAAIAVPAQTCSPVVREEEKWYSAVPRLCLRLRVSFLFSPLRPATCVSRAAWIPMM